VCIAVDEIVHTLVLSGSPTCVAKLRSASLGNWWRSCRVVTVASLWRPLPVWWSSCAPVVQGARCYAVAAHSLEMYL
jgi:hypothetical protein